MTKVIMYRPLIDMHTVVTFNTIGDALFHIEQSRIWNPTTKFYMTTGKFNL